MLTVLIRDGVTQPMHQQNFWKERVILWKKLGILIERAYGGYNPWAHALEATPFVRGNSHKLIHNSMCAIESALG